MIVSIKIFKWVVAGSLAVALTACGGGGSGGVAGGSILDGIAATGAPFTDAIVTVYDASGALVGTSAPVAADGSYSVTLRADAKTPFVVVAIRTGADGALTSLVSVVTDAATRFVNITPITSLIAARLSPTGDPASLAQQMASGAARVTSDTVASRVQEIQALLQPILTALGVTATDPLVGRFTANGTGYDRLLDSVSVNIIPAGTSSNINVAVRARPANDTDQPPTVQFASNAATLPTLPVVTEVNLVPSGTSVQIAGLLTRMTTCFAVPYASRVNNATSTATTGVAADVIAPACRTIFVGGDPSTYKSNGFVVQRTAQNTGAFAGLFRAGATGAVFDQGNFEFRRANNDIVLGYRTRDTAGNETFDSLVAKLDTDGVLKLVGNQYNYNGRIEPFHQERKFITLNQSQWGYYSSGYTMQIDQANSQFAKAEVVTPRGSTITLVADVALDFLKIQNTSGTNALRLRAEFIDAANTLDPRAKLTNEATSLAFANPRLSNDELSALPAQAVWTYRYFLTGNGTTTPDAIQSYSTRTRALTIPEFRNRTLAALSAATIADLQAQANQSGTVPLPTNQPAQPTWVVPNGALPPTFLQLFGRATTPNTTSTFGFNDNVTAGSTVRTAGIPCKAVSQLDTHCNGGTNGGFTANSFMNSIQLFSRDPAGRGFSVHSAMYQLTVVP